MKWLYKLLPADNIRYTYNLSVNSGINTANNCKSITVNNLNAKSDEKLLLKSIPNGILMITPGLKTITNLNISKIQVYVHVNHDYVTNVHNEQMGKTSNVLKIMVSESWGKKELHTPYCTITHDNRINLTECKWN
jgi:hypothetical protein